MLLSYSHNARGRDVDCSYKSPKSQRIYLRLLPTYHHLKISLFCYIVKVCPPAPYPVVTNEEADLREVVLLLVDLVEVTVVRPVWARMLAFLALQVSLNIVDIAIVCSEFQ
jgi:hypothetical protein